MTDYTKLTMREQVKVDMRIINTVDVEHRINKRTGYEWDEPEGILLDVHKGNVCCECLMIYYNCLCSHDD